MNSIPIDGSARDAESIINCGYARLSIWILSRNTCGKTVEKWSRSKAFQKLFAVVPDYCPDKSYFEQREEILILTEITRKFCSTFVRTELASTWESLWIHGDILHGKLEATATPPKKDTYHVQLSGVSTHACRYSEQFLGTSVIRMHQLQSILQLQNSRLKCLQNLPRKMWLESPLEKLYLSLIQLLPKHSVAHSQKQLWIIVQQKRFKKSQPTLSGKAQKMQRSFGKPNGWEWCNNCSGRKSVS